MKIYIEVVATNMESGHVAVSQHSMDININEENKARRNDLKVKFSKELSKSGYFDPIKVGPILIVRRMIAMCALI